MTPFPLHDTHVITSKITKAFLSLGVCPSTKHLLNRDPDNLKLHLWSVWGGVRVSW
jgi:hypothetical protein